MRPLCFVLIPSGKARDAEGRAGVDFDRVYQAAVEPAVRAAGLEPIRADPEHAGRAAYTVTLERLLLCQVAVADLTAASANTYYQLGARVAARPRTTLAIIAEQRRPALAPALLDALPYAIGDDGRFGEPEAEALHRALEIRLREALERSREELPGYSPLLSLVDGRGSPELARLRTDIVRDRLPAPEPIQERLAEARKAGGAAGARAIAEVERELDPLDAIEAAVAVDIYLSYRAVGEYDKMIAFYDRIPPVLQRTVMMREQLAFALNRRAGKDLARRADRDRALRVLEEVLDEVGPNAETYALIGRIYKDRWCEAREAGDDALAAAHLERAIDAYERGFEADWRDAFPGINAATLLDIEGSAASLVRRDRLLPVVRFAVEQRLRGPGADYWDHATLLELAVLAGDRGAAARHLADALAAVREAWEPESTARTLRLLRDARAARREDLSWVDALIDALAKR